MLTFMDNPVKSWSANITVDCKYRQTQMAHLLAVVSNEKVKISNTYVKKTSFRACDWLLFLFTIKTLRRSYDEVVTIL